ncbi:MAG: 5'/3'-nucleotidase SurE [Elusimicrobia bacterium]|nr:5'/3'-nucleotidase SurE [Elusimicrobiota bacterium]MBI4218118.1 5'/3'-nucleotidase SurE [Elusimicrobiota bacterium]
MPRILISNDDGIYGSGLKTLILALRPLAELVVIVPDGERSAASHSITLHKPYRVQKLPMELGKNDVIHVTITNGTPADCVKFGVHEALKHKKIDLIIGGINNGSNLGEDIFYSGTVAIAREGAMLGIPSFAISVTHGTKRTMDQAAKVALKVSKCLLQEKMPPRIFLNVNVPTLPNHNIPIEVTRLGRRVYGKRIPSGIDPRGHQYYWLAGVMPRGIPEKGTDIATVESNKVSLTPISLDSTSFSFLSVLKSWKF